MLPGLSAMGSFLRVFIRSLLAKSASFLPPEELVIGLKPGDCMVVNANEVRIGCGVI